MKKTLMSLAMAAMFGLVASPVMANYIFTVDETSVPGVDSTQVPFQADLINGSYSEMLTVSALPGPLTFTTNAYGNFTSFVLNTVPQSNSGDQFLGSAGAAGYSMYALFSATGYISGPNTFVGLTGTASLWLDPDRNTTKALGTTGADPIVLGNTTDDYMIASTSSFESGFGIASGVTGAYDLFFTDFLLTTGDNNANYAGLQNGDLYFTDPRPFYLRINLDGDFNTPSFVPGSNSAVAGDLSLIFVPEPGSLALLGLGLAGLGLMQRRRKAVN